MCREALKLLNDNVYTFSLFLHFVLKIVRSIGTCTEKVSENVRCLLRCLTSRFITLDTYMSRAKKQWRAASGRSRTAHEGLL